MKKLLILSTQRSGSTMICSDIASTEVLGHPNEYFIKPIELWHAKKNKTELIEAINSIPLHSSSSNGIQAIKIMSNQICSIGTILETIGLAKGRTNLDCFFNYFSDYIFVRVSRNDKVAQAVSRIMAESTGIYHHLDPTKSILKLGRSSSRERNEAGIEYSYDLIQKNIDTIINEEKTMQNYLEIRSITPFEIIYETSVSSRSYINEIARRLKVPPISIFADRSMKKVAGPISEAWIKRFKNEKI